MAKRFTDTKKWRNEWFRTLPTNAKLAWIYLCDECESHGVMKLDYGLASFQLGFDVTPEILWSWFYDKIHFLTPESLLIVQFFEFQYGDSKETWSAKARAKEKLESLGFLIENNKLSLPKKEETTTVVPLCTHSVPTRLIRVRGNSLKKGSVRGNKNETENISFEAVYKKYPVQIKGHDAEKRFNEQIKSPQDISDLSAAVDNYVSFLSQPENSWRKPKQSFSAFLGTKSSGYFWKDFINRVQITTATIHNPYGISRDL